MNLLPLSPLQLQALNRGTRMVRVKMELPSGYADVAEIAFAPNVTNEGRPSWIAKHSTGRSLMMLSPHQPGDTVAIGEEWAYEPPEYDMALSSTKPVYAGGGFLRRADLPDLADIAWQPASTMPLEFARHFRVIGDVKAVRCQEATDAEHSFDRNEWLWQYELTEMKGGAE